MAEPPAAGQKVDAYLSYSRTDSVHVHAVADHLSHEGITYFADWADLAPGKEWTDALVHAVANARFFLVFVGSAGLTSVQLEELERARANVLPVLLPGARELPRQLARLQAHDLRDGVDPAGLALLVDAIRGGESPPQPVELSPSVVGVSRVLTGDVTAPDMVWELYKVHLEYAGAKSAQLAKRADDVRKPAEQWLAEVRDLYDPAAVPELHGRLVILGLALIDPPLRGDLERDGVLRTLIGEVEEEFASLLSPRGRALWDAVAAQGETVPTHTDNPATVDALQREGFARVLGSRVRAMREKEKEAARKAGDAVYPRGRAFLVHLDGPWGAGKTTLLNFLGRELQSRPNPWVVVTFNAWQHQRIVPPWWWLMSSVHEEGFRALWHISKPWAVLFKVREWAWLLRALWAWIVLALAGVVVAFLLWYGGKLSDLDVAQKWLAAAVALVGSVVTLAGAARSVAGSVNAKTAQGAKTFIQQTRDPMQSAKDHFADLIRWLHYDVAIFVDDLDRCKGSSVVELLEGIQTLFRDVPVAYVVAADRAWLSDSYAAEYERFTSLADEPGRPFGFRFLEKTFQMAATVPTMNERALSGFWQGLIRPGELGDREALEAARAQADSLFATLETEESIRAELLSNPGATPEERQARVEAAAIKLAAPRFERSTEHALRDFVHLLDPNPRALKRLVNAYGIARDLQTLNRQNLVGDVGAQQRTALWTIVNLRWPQLAEHLADHPDDVAAIGNGRPPDRVPEELRPLFDDERVIAVVRGRADGVDATLDPAAVRECLGWVETPAPEPVS